MLHFQSILQKYIWCWYFHFKSLKITIIYWKTFSFLALIWSWFQPDYSHFVIIKRIFLKCISYENKCFLFTPTGISRIKHYELVLSLQIYEIDFVVKMLAIWHFFLGYSEFYFFYKLCKYGQIEIVEKYLLRSFEQSLKAGSGQSRPGAETLVLNVQVIVQLVNLSLYCRPLAERLANIEENPDCK